MFKEIIKNIAVALNRKKIPYMIIGGQAVLLYGEPRLTRDIDITLGIGIDRIKEILGVLDEAGLKVLVKDINKFVNETMVLPAIEGKTRIRVDFIFSFTPYEKQAINNSKKILLDDIEVSFASPEDIIIHKIFSGRPRDIEDIKSILLKNKNIDIKYINKWLKEFQKTFPEKNFIEKFEEILHQTKK